VQVNRIVLVCVAVKVFLFALRSAISTIGGDHDIGKYGKKDPHHEKGVFGLDKLSATFWLFDRGRLHRTN